VPSDAYAEFVAAITKILSDKGIELPSIPDSVGRRAYLSLLHESGYSEDEVLPVFDPKNLTGQALGATFVGLMQALNSDNPDLLRSVSWIAVNSVTGRDNTNLILHALAEKLTRELRIQTAIPDFYVGVFPTDSFNAQSRIYNGTNLLLIDTGCMETAEAVVATFLSKKSQEAKIQDILEAANQYLDAGVRPNAASLSLPGIDWGSAPVSLVLNSVEDFMVSHELGHLVLGHVKEDCTRKYLLPNEKSAELVEKTELQEFQADSWACNAIVERALRQSSSREELGVALAGAMIALGIGLVLEAALRKRHASMADGHPSAVDRIYLVRKLYQFLRVQNDAGIGDSFVEMVRACLGDCFAADAPPMSAESKLDVTFQSVLKSLASSPPSRLAYWSR
jgi:hypothetical protein